MKTCIRLLSLFLALLLLLSLCGCGASTVRASANAQKTVAKVGNVKILYEEIYYLANNYIYDRKLAKGDDVMKDPAEREALSAYIEEMLLSRDVILRDLAKTYGIKLDSGKIADQVESYLNDSIDRVFGGDRAAYVESLQKEFLTEHYVRTFLAVTEYLATELVLEMIERGEIDDSDEAARALIEGEDCIRTIQVVIKKDNGNTAEQNLANVQSLYLTVSSKADPTERYLAMCQAVGSKYNNDHGDIMGDGYYFVRGEMEKGYEDVAFALDEYGVSEVTELNDGYYLIMRLPKQQDYIESHFQALKESSYFVKLNELVERRQSELTPQMTRFGRSLDLCDLAPIDADGGTSPAVLFTVGGVVLLGGGGVLFVLLRKRRKTK